MAFFRSILTTKITSIAATAAIPIAVSAYSLSPSSSTWESKNLSFGSPGLSLYPNYRPEKSFLVKSLANPPAVSPEMDQKPPSEKTAVVPVLLTEYMVDMACEGCVNSVKTKLQTVDGVANIDVDLANQVVRVLGTAPSKILTEALEQTGKKARLIGQGVPEDFLVSAAVAEFKGPVVFGVVRIGQVNMELVRVEANFSGLAPGKHGWSINQFGDLTRGAASTGKIYSPTDYEKEPLGDLGTLDADNKGEAFFSSAKEKLRVADLIGRSIVVYRSEDKTDEGLVAAVVARSAGVGENYKKLCTCDGTTIWEATNADFVPSKV